jgi:hypothetical protein
VAKAAATLLTASFDIKTCPGLLNDAIYRNAGGGSVVTHPAKPVTVESCVGMMRPGRR